MPKKLIFTLLLGIFGFSSTYASFPVTVNENTLEEVDFEEKTVTYPVKETPFGNWSLIMGLVWGPLVFFGLLLSTNEVTGGVIIIAGAISFIGAMITGIMSLKRGEKPKWKAIIGLVLTLGIILLSIIAPAIEKIPWY